MSIRSITPLTPVDRGRIKKDCATQKKRPFPPPIRRVRRGANTKIFTDFFMLLFSEIKTALNKLPEENRLDTAIALAARMTELQMASDHCVSSGYARKEPTRVGITLTEIIEGMANGSG